MESGIRNIQEYYENTRLPEYKNMRIHTMGNDIPIQEK